MLQNLLALARLLGPKLPLWMPVLLAIARKAPVSEIIPLVLAALEGTFAGQEFSFSAAGSLTDISSEDAHEGTVLAEYTAAGCDADDVVEFLNAE